MLISRDWASATDDNLTTTYEFNADFQFYHLIDFLKKENFFGDAPKNSLWVMSYNGIEIGTYILSSGFGILVGCIDHLFMKDDGNIHFKFFLNTETRANHLYHLHCGNKKEMYTEGHWFEYKSYHINQEIEETWRESLLYQEYDDTEDVKMAVSFLKKIMIRPGIYVGAGRLDFVKIFYDGWSIGQKTLWNIDYDLERWLFLKESVSTTASINSWTIFQETFGVVSTGIEKFREFLEETIPTSVLNRKGEDTVHEDISSSYSSHKEPRHRLLPYLNYVNTEHVVGEEAYLEIIHQIKRLIGHECKRIKVFLNLGRIVLQVRFFYDDGLGWKDGVSLKSTPNYYEQLIVLHGYVNLLKKKGTGAASQRLIGARKIWRFSGRTIRQQNSNFSLLPRKNI